MPEQTRWFRLSKDQSVARLRNGWDAQVWHPKAGEWADYPDLDWVHDGTEITQAEAEKLGAAPEPQSPAAAVAEAEFPEENMQDAETPRDRAMARRVALVMEAHDKGAEPFSASKTSNWVAKSGGLPHYIQHVAHDLMEKRGKSESEAIQMAIGIIKRWARGGGGVKPDTKAAAAKALAEWEAMKAKSHAKPG